MRFSGSKLSWLRELLPYLIMKQCTDFGKGGLVCRLRNRGVVLTRLFWIGNAHLTKIVCYSLHHPHQMSSSA
jgi:hypothetical protein